MIDITTIEAGANASLANAPAVAADLNLFANVIGFIPQAAPIAAEIRVTAAVINALAAAGGKLPKLIADLHDLGNEFESAIAAAKAAQTSTNGNV